MCLILITPKKTTLISVDTMNDDYTYPTHDETHTHTPTQTYSIVSYLCARVYSLNESTKQFPK